VGLGSAGPCDGRDLAIRWDLPDHGASYRTTLHNGVMTSVKDSDKPVSLSLTSRRRP
jgi:linear primary-alkylsulfatase